MEAGGEVVRSEPAGVTAAAPLDEAGRLVELVIVTTTVVWTVVVCEPEGPARGEAGSTWGEAWLVTPKPCVSTATRPIAASATRLRTDMSESR